MKGVVTSHSENGTHTNLEKVRVNPPLSFVFVASATNLIITYSILNPLRSLLAFEDLGGLCTIWLTKAQPDYNNSYRIITNFVIES